jgi:hypothetical protein
MLERHIYIYNIVPQFIREQDKSNKLQVYMQLYYTEYYIEN